MKSKKCKCCGKEMTKDEYIAYLEKEVARLENELRLSKLSGTISIPAQPAPYVPPVDAKWPKPFPQITWQSTDGTAIIGVPTGGMCSTSCCMYKDDDGKCVMCHKTWEEIKSEE